MTRETERERFETWVSSKCYRIKRNEGALQYATKNTQLLWQAWQARAALEAKQVDVKMPEPAEFQVRIRPTWDAKHHWTIWDKCTPEAAADYERTPLLHEWEYEVRKLFTEQQVRTLLAQIGKSMS